MSDHEKDTPQGDAVPNEVQENKPATETETLPKTTSSPQPASEPVTHISEQPKSGRGIAAIALGLAIISAASAGFVWWQQQQQQIHYEGVIQQQKQQISGLEKSIQQSLDQQIQSHVDAQSKPIQQQVAKLDHLIQQEIKQLKEGYQLLSGRRSSDWILAEAQYLVKLASRKLYLEQDFDTAKTLLINADDRLGGLREESITELRTALHQDIARLKELPVVDTVGIHAELSGLLVRVDGLTLRQRYLPKSEEVKGLQLSENVDDVWQNLSSSFQTFLDDFVKIRRVDQGQLPVVSPEQSWFIKSQIKMALIEAQQAALLKEPKAYAASLNQVATWVEAYFEPKAEQVQSMLGEVQTLAKRPVKTTLPAQIESEALIDDAVTRRTQGRLTLGEMKQEDTIQ